MGDKTKAFWLGLFIVVAIGVLIGFVLFLKPSVGDGLTHLKVHFSNIDKISKGSQVTYAGRPVGEVVAIREVPHPQEARADAAGNLYVYELLLAVDSSVKVYTYDEILFATSGLLGEKSIAIIPKATPHGAPKAQNVSGDVLYAQSNDRFEQTLNKLCAVADSLDETMHHVCDFIKDNNHDFNVALKSLNRASCSIESFMDRAYTTDVAGRMAAASDKLALAAHRVDSFFATAESVDLLERMGNSFETIGLVTEAVATGEGSLSRLINSDSFYVQFTTVLCQLRAILEDIQNYGLLYQFNRQWKRSHQAN